MTFQPLWPETRVGATREGRPIEWSGTMTALAYFNRGWFEVVADRPIVCTDTDLVARVERVFRCGTDVKMYDAGRPDQVEESLLDELRAIFAIDELPGGGVPFLAYAQLATGGEADPVHAGDPLYAALTARIAALTPEARADLPRQARRFWGRILGHETVVTVEHVGSRVGELRQGIGYLDGVELGAEDLAFEPGQQCVLQSRIAYYDPPDRPLPGARGIQLLGGNITDLAMNQGGAYATRVRLNHEIIRSGSVLRVPAGIDVERAALCEPTACLLDCFQKTTHEAGQDASGSVLLKGVRHGGVTCVIGSGTMALMAALMATMDDPVIDMGRAREVVFIVRSREKAGFVERKLAEAGLRVPVRTVICANDEEMPEAVRQQVVEPAGRGDARPFGGFDDVILAAGGAQSLAVAHRLIAPTGGRLMAFAGTRGACTLESGVWHYGNAGVLGTSGCNTNMMQVALGLFARGSLRPETLAGISYSFADLRRPGGIEAFFHDKHLRPCLMPNAEG